MYIYTKAMMRGGSLGCLGMLFSDIIDENG